MRSVSFIAVGVLTLAALQGVALADGIDIAAGDKIRLYDGVGNGSGGEFDAVLLGTSPVVEWATFCLESDEYFYSGQILRVASVTDTAQLGGSNTNSGDLLDARTAWLYTQFWNGTLAGLNAAGTATSGDYLDSHAANATHLQGAIWFIENESIGVDNYYVDLAEAAVLAGWSGIGQVRVLNLERYDGRNWVHAQDQLVMTPIPEPASLALFGLGAGAFVALRRRRRKLA